MEGDTLDDQDAIYYILDDQNTNFGTFDQNTNCNNQWETAASHCEEDIAEVLLAMDSVTLPDLCMDTIAGSSLMSHVSSPIAVTSSHVSPSVVNVNSSSSMLSSISSSTSSSTSPMSDNRHSSTSSCNSGDLI